MYLLDCYDSRLHEHAALQIVCDRLCYQVKLEKLCRQLQAERLENKAVVENLEAQLLAGSQPSQDDAENAAPESAGALGASSGAPGGALSIESKMST